MPHPSLLKRWSNENGMVADMDHCVFVLLFFRPRKCEKSKMQKSKNAKMQKDNCVFVFLLSWPQKCEKTKLQECEMSKMRKCEKTKLQKCEVSKMRKCKIRFRFRVSMLFIYSRDSRVAMRSSPLVHGGGPPSIRAWRRGWGCKLSNLVV